MSELAVGKVIKMPCMRSGLVSYPNETILVTKAALDFMMSSAIGIPVIIDHPETPVTAETIKDMPVVGRVADLHYIEDEELWYAHFVVDDADAVKMLESGYGVSTAWYGSRYTAGGTYNNVPYDRELLEGRYEHLAIVATPRYEMATSPIFLNSKGGQGVINDATLNNENPIGVKSMIGKLFKRLISKEEIKINSGEEYVVEVDGQEMNLAQVIEAARTNKNDDGSHGKKKLNEDDKVDVDGEQMTVTELIEKYKTAKKASKKNDDDADAKKLSKKNEDDDDADDKMKTKRNEDDDEDDKMKSKDDDDAKKNAKTQPTQEEIDRFNALDNAHKNGIKTDAQQWMSLHERVEMGKSRWGSAKK